MALLTSPSVDVGMAEARPSRIGPPSPPNDRIIGLVYIGYFALTIASQLTLKGMIVSGDAAAANDILAHRELYRLGLTLGLGSTAAYVAVTALFYALFKPVDAKLSRMAAFFSLTGCAVQAFSAVFQAAPLAVLGDGRALRAVDALQREELAQIFLKLYAQGVSIALVFFGLYCLLLGYLIFRSGFLPRALGVLMFVAGLGWLTFLWPPLAHALAIPVQGVGVIAEAALMLWLLTAGVSGAAQATLLDEGMHA